MRAARMPRLGSALVVSVLCHGGVLAALAATTLPAPPRPPAAHAVSLALFAHPPLPAAAPPPPRPEKNLPTVKPVAKPVVKPTLKAQPIALPRPSAMIEPVPAPQPEPAAAAPQPAPPPPQPAPLPVVLKPDYLIPPIPPVYPAAARRLQIEGTVVVRALVERPGPPSQVTLWRSSGEVLLDRSALDAVRGWRFRPMTQGDDTVAAWVEVPITFSLSNT